jgi:hypothetical protein
MLFCGQRCTGSTSTYPIIDHANSGFRHPQAEPDIAANQLLLAADALNLIERA